MTGINGCIFDGDMASRTREMRESLEMSLSRLIEHAEEREVSHLLATYVDADNILSNVEDFKEKIEKMDDDDKREYDLLASVCKKIMEKIERTLEKRCKK